MKQFFGADGIRGEANSGLTVLHAFQIGRFLGWYYGRAHRCKVAIGKDTRRSSYMFEDALSAGLTASGADVYLLHVTTTANVAYTVRTEEFDCGIMISASHAPFYDNGIKLLNGHGEMPEPSVIEELEKYLAGEIPELPLAVGDKIGCTTDYAAGRNRYIGYLLMLATHSFRGKRIALDCANGSAFFMARSVFESLGAKVYTIHCEPDGTNINQDCGSLYPEDLQRYVAEEHLDIGFAFDGDADRCIAVDETGCVVDGDRLLYLCASYMRDIGQLSADTVVITSKAGQGLNKALKEAGIRCVQAETGSGNVYKAMMEHGARLGGDPDGHLIFGKYASTCDGILTALKIMEVILERKKTLHELAWEY